ncbi:MAG: Gfo/Idh/MocA family oxidoreductase [Kosmotoga sp.]|nr:MAG: Gfo/Idh/MocA family oxidoreductase [Kosmotoga sp.]
MDKMKIGIIGAGKMGVTHCGAFMRHKKAKVISVCDTDKAKADNLAEGNWLEVEDYKGRFLPKYVIKKVYDDYKELVSKSDIDAVVITTSEDSQYEIAKDALENNKHVLVEQPFTENYDQAEELIELADKKNLILSVNQCWRFHPHIQYARNIVGSGILGEITKVKGYGLKDSKQKNNCLDIIDTVSYLFGKMKIKYVVGNFMNTLDLDVVEDIGVVLMGFDSGASGIFEFGGPNPTKNDGEPTIQIFGTQGYLNVFPTSIKLYFKDEEGQFYPELCDWYFSKELFIRQARSFISSILRGKDNINSGRSYLETIKINNAIDKSKKENRIVFLDKS